MFNSSSESIAESICSAESIRTAESFPSSYSTRELSVESENNDYELDSYADDFEDVDDIDAFVESLGGIVDVTGTIDGQGIEVERTKKDGNRAMSDNEAAPDSNYELKANNISERDSVPLGQVETQDTVSHETLDEIVEEGSGEPECVSEASVALHTASESYKSTSSSPPTAPCALEPEVTTSIIPHLPLITSSHIDTDMESIEDYLEDFESIHEENRTPPEDAYQQLSTQSSISEINASLKSGSESAEAVGCSLPDTLSSDELGSETYGSVNSGSATPRHQTIPVISNDVPSRTDGEDLEYTEDFESVTENSPRSTSTMPQPEVQYESDFEDIGSWMSCEPESLNTRSEQEAENEIARYQSIQSRLYSALRTRVLRNCSQKRPEPDMREPGNDPVRHGRHIALDTLLSRVSHHKNERVPEAPDTETIMIDHGHKAAIPARWLHRVQWRNVLDGLKEPRLQPYELTPHERERELCRTQARIKNTYFRSKIAVLHQRQNAFGQDPSQYDHIQMIADICKGLPRFADDPEVVWARLLEPTKK
ncbi:uncharacterized protein SPPG_09258 [Spizellomyces punctatus DAOM BR117]|uniref:Uncharacterized protein n=1 Tax=Spizellomyces punctatus (strain DAOM BR117) TaxID=645134 RepID=A0A0L0HE78_SPIPD|nr:uncharacterized protein SPPG_09258 [Spizellomyces punctatus DAOM BR117]KNC99760.1 hypothetical protein SPPG_09258 [Spizellomyces punctatus DAOM BR117]|eukprot:XP_016607800.1 hypothetical protein SPPG_09258 [Spizellomyces punctatus DAOM BR117]